MKTYDFILQSTTPGAAVDPARVEAALGADALRTAGGELTWGLAAGVLEVRSVVDAGQITGVELRVPLSGETMLLKQTLERGWALATSLELAFVDPQLGRTVRPEFLSQVEESFLKTARYAGEYLGVSEAIGAGTPRPSDDDEGLSPSVRIVLFVVVFVLMAFIAYRAMQHE